MSAVTLCPTTNTATAVLSDTIGVEQLIRSAARPLPCECYRNTRILETDTSPTKTELAIRTIEQDLRAVSMSLVGLPASRLSHAESCFMGDNYGHVFDEPRTMNQTN